MHKGKMFEVSEKSYRNKMELLNEKILSFG